VSRESTEANVLQQSSGSGLTSGEGQAFVPRVDLHNLGIIGQLETLRCDNKIEARLRFLSETFGQDLNYNGAATSALEQEGI
jgi:hypothetical protein